MPPSLLASLTSTCSSPCSSSQILEFFLGLLRAGISITSSFLRLTLREHIMALGIGRALAAPLLLLNFLMYCIVLGIAGWSLNKAIDYGWPAVSDSNATFYLVIFSLIAGVVGVASKLSGAHHLASWEKESLAGTAAAAFIAWLLTLLAFGLACKEIHMGGHRMRRLKALEAFVIILAGTQLLYLLIVGGGSPGGAYGRRGERNRTTAPEGQKDAAAV